jgi:hypothetical protein
MANYRGLSPDGVSESRRAPRVELVDRIHGQLTSIDLEVVVRDIGLVGMSIDAPLRFPTDAIHEFRLTLGDGSNVLVRGRVVHSNPHTDDHGAQYYVTGFEFLEDQPRESPAIENLVDKVTTPRQNVPVKR